MPLNNFIKILIHYQFLWCRYVFWDVYDDMYIYKYMLLRTYIYYFFVDPVQVVVLAARKHPQALQHASWLGSSAAGLAECFVGYP